MPAPEQTATDTLTELRHLRALSTSAYPAHVDRWAIIVGISQYQQERLNLKFADRDAEELYKLLQTPSGGGFEVDKIMKLVNEDATTARVQRALRSFLKKPAKEDIVLLYFACHGAPDVDRPNIVYLLTYDTDPDDVSGTALPMREIDLSLKENLLAERVVIIADTCHSAAIGGGIGRRSTANEAQAINAYLDEVSKARGGVALLTSAEASETAQEGQQWGEGHGVFTHFLLEGMRGAADGYSRPRDGIVTIGELFDYVRDSVKHATNNQQHPAIGTNSFDRNLPIAITGGVNAREHYQLGRHLYELGWLLDDPKRFQAAARQFRTAIQLSQMARTPFPEAESGLGQALLAAGDATGAIQALSQLCDRNATTAPPQALFELGIAYAKQGNVVIALPIFEQFVTQNPQHELTSFAHAYTLALKRNGTGAKRALLIGINQYKFISPLSGCVTDVELIKEVLQKVGFQETDIVVLIDKQATRTQILRALKQLSQNTLPDDTVVVHFSGWGMGHQGPQMYVYDSKPKNEEIVNGIMPAELHQLLNQIPTYHKTFVFDAKSTKEFAEYAKADASYNLLLATEPDKLPFEAYFELPGSRARSGVLTGAFAEALIHADPQQVTYTELLDAMRQSIRKRKIDQTPLFIGNLEQFIFSREDPYLIFWTFARCRNYTALTSQQITKYYNWFSRQISVPLPQVHAGFGYAFLEKGTYPKALMALATAIQQSNQATADPILALGKAHIHMRAYDDALPNFQQYITVAPVEVKTIAQRLVEQTEKARQSQPHALLIGINEYVNPAVSPLNGAVNDALALQEVLRTNYKLQPEHMTVLLDHDATRAAILEAFRRLVEIARDEPVLFYFAGHGSTIRNNQGVESRKEELALVSTDSRTEGVYDIAVSELAELAAQTPNLVVIIDAGWTRPFEGLEVYRTIAIDERERPLLRRAVLLSDAPDLTSLTLPIGCLTIYYGINEAATEEELPDPQAGQTKKVYGRSTHKFVQYLWQADPATLTYTELIKSTKASAQGNNQDSPLFFNHACNAAILQLIQEIEQAPIKTTIDLLRRLIEQCEQQDDLYPEGRLNLGIAYAAIADYDKSISYLERAVALYSDPTLMRRELEKDPNAWSHYYEARYQLGRVLFESKRDFSRAVSELTEATKDTENVRAFYYLGQAIRAMVEHETLTKAEAALQTYLSKGAPLGHEDEVREFLGSRKKPEASR